MGAPMMQYQGMGMSMGGAWGGGDPHVSPQFTQPTRVIHLRNLPFDLSIEEIRELCAPFGTVVAVKDKVGSMRNQAFVEFASIEQSVGIVSHFQTSTTPAAFRGRPTWLSYSGRDKLTNVNPTTDQPTPVLQVSMKSIPAELANAISLDLLNSAFAPYGLPRKIVTYNKPEGGILAWVQFADAPTAASVRAALDGQPFPKHLVSEHPSPPRMEIAFSTHPDLAVGGQSQCTRDFANAALPWGEPDWTMIQSLLPSGAEGASSNVLSISFDNMTYPVTVDGIHTICSTYGYVQKIHLFEREGKTNALVQYPDVRTADVARASLQGHAMYDGGHNVMHVTYSKHRNLTIRPGERSRDYTAGALPNGPLPMAPMQQPPAGAPMAPTGMPAGVPMATHMGTGMGTGTGTGMGMPSGAAAAGVPHKPPPPPGNPPPPRPPAGAPPQVAQYQPAAAPPTQQPQPLNGFHVSGEEYVRQHEVVLQQYGGRISGRSAAAPYAAAPAAPAYAPPAPANPAQPAAPAYPPAQPAAAAYYGAPPPAAYGAQPAGAYPNQQAAAYGAQPASAYGAQQAAAYGAQPAAGYGAQPAAAAGYYGQPQAPPAYGAQPPAPPAYGAAPAYGSAPAAQGAGYGAPAAGYYGAVPSTVPPPPAGAPPPAYGQQPAAPMYGAYPGYS